MADDPFDFLEGSLGDAPAPAPELAQAEPPPPAPAEGVQPAPEGGSPPAAPQGELPPLDNPPLPAFLDMRDRAKKAERELAELRQQIESQTKPQPTFQDDPSAWEARQQQALRDVEVKTTMALSGRFAAQQHGEDKVRAAMEWGSAQNQADPTFGQRFISNPDPYGWLVQQHQRDQTLTALGGKTFEEAAKAWAESQGFVAGAAQQPAAAPPQPVAPATPPPAAPPRSLASTGSAAAQPGKQTLSEKDVSEGLFA
jgi:hypothetical protein